MADNNTSKVRTVLKASYLVISRSVLYTLLGVVINWTYVFIAIGPMANKYGVAFPGSRVWIGAIIGLFMNIHIVIYFLIFFALIPFLYFWFGKTVGIKKGIALSFDLVKPKLYEYITRVAISVKEKTAVQSGAKKTVKKAADSVMKRYADLPGGIKKIFQFIIAQLPMKDLIEKAAKTTTLSENNFEQSRQAVTQLADSYIKEQLLAPSYIMLFVLLTVDVAAVIVTVLLV